MTLKLFLQLGLHNCFNNSDANIILFLRGGYFLKVISKQLQRKLTVKKGFVRKVELKENKQIFSKFFIWFPFLLTLSHFSYCYDPVFVISFIEFCLHYVYKQTFVF